MQINDFRELDFEIDELTSSIQNAITGEIFDTEVTRLESARSIKKADWLFDWHSEIRNKQCEIYKLNTINNDHIIQGLISYTDKEDHIFLNLIESAKFNKGIGKQYKGVAGNLVAYCCKVSFEKKYNGIVSFIAKTRLIDHYKNTLGATLFDKNRMFIDTKEAMILAKQYLMISSMINFKKMDDKDFVFIKEQINKEDDKLFSDFLKNRKTKILLKKKTRVSKRVA